MSSEQTEPTTSGSTVIDAAVVDPATGLVWPHRFDTRAAARYLRVAHSLPIAELTLVRQRTRGVGIRWKYLGQKPIAERSEIDRFAREDALREVSPLAAGAQARADRERERRPRARINVVIIEARLQRRGADDFVELSLLDAGNKPLPSWRLRIGGAQAGADRKIIADLLRIAGVLPGDRRTLDSRLAALTGARASVELGSDGRIIRVLPDAD